MSINKQLKKMLLILWTILTVYLAIEVTQKNYYLVLFSPDDAPKNTIVSLINKSQHNIIIAMYAFTEQGLSNALIQAKNRGVDIKLIIDKWSLRSNFNKLQSLTANNIPIKIYNKSGLMHHKFAVFDNKTVCTGSLNWTKAACKYNQENILITDDKNIAKRYINQFDKLERRCKSNPLKSDGTDFINA